MKVDKATFLKFIKPLEEKKVKSCVKSTIVVHELTISQTEVIKISLNLHKKIVTQVVKHACVQLSHLADYSVKFINDLNERRSEANVEINCPYHEFRAKSEGFVEVMTNLMEYSSSRLINKIKGRKARKDIKAKKAAENERIRKQAEDNKILRETILHEKKVIRRAEKKLKAEQDKIKEQHRFEMLLKEKMDEKKTALKRSLSETKILSDRTKDNLIQTLLNEVRETQEKLREPKVKIQKIEIVHVDPKELESQITEMMSGLPSGRFHLDTGICNYAKTLGLNFGIMENKDLRNISVAQKNLLIRYVTIIRRSKFCIWFRNEMYKNLVKGHTKFLLTYACPTYNCELNELPDKVPFAFQTLSDELGKIVTKGRKSIWSN